MGIFDQIKAFFIIYFISVAFIYGLQSRSVEPIIVPGDIYVKKGLKGIYIPLGSSLLLTIVLFLIFKKLASF